MRVILLQNVSVNEGLTNGAIGTIISCHNKTVKVQFNHKLRFITRTTIGNAKQIPLRMAYGMTACKIQGQDINDSVCVDGTGMKLSEVYTSITRSKYRNQLQFRNISTTTFKLLAPHSFQAEMRQRDIFSNCPPYWNPPQPNHLRFSYAFTKHTPHYNGINYMLLHTAIFRKSDVILLVNPSKFTQPFITASHQSAHIQKKIVSICDNNRILIIGARSTSQNYRRAQFHYRMNENITFTLTFKQPDITDTTLQLQFPDYKTWTQTPSTFKLLHVTGATIIEKMKKPIDILQMEQLETIDFIY